MRRKDREVTDKVKIEELIEKCHCIRLGFYDKGEVYIVPLNYGYKFLDDTYTFYFHGAKEGRKAELIKTSPQVGFELDAGFELHPGDEPAECSCAYQSIIGTGVTEMIDSVKDKTEALDLIMYHYSKRRPGQYPIEILKRTLIFKMTVDKLSCKEHL